MLAPKQSVPDHTVGPRTSPPSEEVIRECLCVESFGPLLRLVSEDTTDRVVHYPA